MLAPVVLDPLHVAQLPLQLTTILAEPPPLPDHLQLPGDPQLAGHDPLLEPAQMRIGVHFADLAR
jgi:hypothetical protein